MVEFMQEMSWWCWIIEAANPILATNWHGNACFPQSYYRKMHSFKMIWQNRWSMNYFINSHKKYDLFLLQIKMFTLHEICMMQNNIAMSFCKLFIYKFLLFVLYCSKAKKKKNTIALLSSEKTYFHWFIRLRKLDR